MTQPVADAHDRTVRWRQLVDLLSRPHDEIDPALLDAALTMVRTGMKSVARAIRAATARSIAGRASEPRLIAIFAEDKLDVAAPLLAAAPLDEAGWATVLSSASAEVADFVRTIRGDVAPAAEPAAEAAPSEAEPESPAAEEPAPSIGDMVARIERLKSKRETPTAHEEEAEEVHAPVARPEPVTGPGLFRWECDASGQIGWVEGAPRGALIGRSLPGDDRRAARAGPRLYRPAAVRRSADQSAGARAGRRMATERDPGLFARAMAVSSAIAALHGARGSRSSRRPEERWGVWRQAMPRRCARRSTRSRPR